MERRGGDEHIYVIVIWASLQNSQLPSSGAEDSCGWKERRDEMERSKDAMVNR
jgi:hypothetical protein